MPVTASLALAAGQAVLGGIQAIGGASAAKRAKAQRKAFKTPEEVAKILAATESRAQQGYDPATMDYLTSQTDRAFAGALGVISRFGGDANAVAAAFDQKIQSTMKIGAENHALNMENFSKFIDGLNLVAKNKEAEWKSTQDMLKDEQQAANENMQAGIKNVFGAANTAIGGLSAGKQMQLYTDRTNVLKGMSLAEKIQAGLSKVEDMPLYDTLGTNTQAKTS
jgi:hypothetical protein